MTSRESEIARIERARQKREDELLLLLLLWSDRARRTALAAARLGHDPADAIRQVLVGNDHFEGVAPAIASYMTSAHVSAYRRVARTVGVSLPAEASVLYEPGLYDPAAADAAERMVTVLTSKVRDMMYRTDPLTAIRTAFNAGASRVDSSYLDTVSTMNVLRGWNTGAHAAMHTEDISDKITGFEHVSVIDEGTTSICRDRDGLKLPKDHPYWRGPAWPSLHWDCRSFIRPLTGSFIPSESLPTVPPMAGFGYPPTWGVAGMAA